MQGPGIVIPFSHAKTMAVFVGTFGISCCLYLCVCMCMCVCVSVNNIYTASFCEKLNLMYYLSIMLN